MGIFNDHYMELVAAHLVKYPIYKLIFVTTFEIILFLSVRYTYVRYTYLSHMGGGQKKLAENDDM